MSDTSGTGGDALSSGHEQGNDDLLAEPVADGAGGSGWPMDGGGTTDAADGDGVMDEDPLGDDEELDDDHELDDSGP